MQKKIYAIFKNCATKGLQNPKRVFTGPSLFSEVF